MKIKKDYLFYGLLSLLIFLSVIGSVNLMKQNNLKQAEAQSLQTERDVLSGDLLVLDRIIGEYKETIEVENINVEELNAKNTKVSQLVDAYSKVQKVAATERYNNRLEPDLNEAEESLAKVAVIYQSDQWVLGNKDWTLKSDYISPQQLGHEGNFTISVYDTKDRLVGIVHASYDEHDEMLLIHKFERLSAYGIEENLTVMGDY